MLDVLIKNAQIIDGTGKPAYAADIGVRRDQIVWIGKKTERSKLVIDALGRYVTPGFIDAQNHADSYWTLFDYPHQESMLHQGITTIALGHSGASLAPLPNLEAFKSTQKWHSLAGVNFNWQYFDEYLAEISRHDIGTNVLSLIGHSTIRRGLLGDEIRKITQAELKLMSRLTLSSLKTGAYGLSFGLQYAHEFDSSKEELLVLAGIIKQADRVLSVQMRNYGQEILAAFEEVAELAQQTGVRIKISHLKIEGREHWRYFEQLLKQIEKAYQKGVVIEFDVYPYTTSWRVLYTYLPKWAYAGGRAQLLERISEPFHARKIEQALLEHASQLGNMIIAHVSSGQQLVGKKLSEIAKSQGNSVPETLVSILRTNESDVIVFDENISLEQMEVLLAHPLSIIASDGAGFSYAPSSRYNLVHPRCFGAMPRFLQIAFGKKILTPESAVEKISGRPAKLYGLLDRGVLAKGKKADIVILNPKIIADTASLASPFQKPKGIDWVLVNGVVSVADGVATEQYRGKVLLAG